MNESLLCARVIIAGLSQFRSEALQVICPVSETHLNCEGIVLLCQEEIESFSAKSAHWANNNTRRWFEYIFLKNLLYLCMLVTFLAFGSNWQFTHSDSETGLSPEGDKPSSDPMMNHYINAYTTCLRFLESNKIMTTNWRAN